MPNEGKSTEEQVEVIRRGLRRRFGKRIMEGNYKNPFASPKHCLTELERAMSEYYQMLLDRLPATMQGTFWKEDSK